MTWILEAAAILCLVYYGILAFYSGMTTSFALFWPALAVALMMMAAALHFKHRHPQAVPVWLTVSVTTAVIASAAVFVIVEMLIMVSALSPTRQAMDYVIVLGAKVNGNVPSNSLKKRLNKALEYAENNPNTILVLSGGQGPDESVSEASVMYDYLVFNGVPKEQMLVETKSCNTRENISFSRAVIERHENWKAMVLKQELKESYRERAEGDTVKIGILTSNFHLLRAKSIAKKQGVPGAYGIAAPSDPLMAVHLWVRECFAVLKDKFMGAM